VPVEFSFQPQRGLGLTVAEHKKTGVWVAVGIGVLVIAKASSNGGQPTVADKTTIQVVEPPQTPAQRKAELDSLLAQTRTTSPDDTIANVKLYGRLHDLQPKNKKYAEQADLYTTRVDANNAAKDHPEQGLELAHYSWATSGFGNIMMATFVLRNKSDFSIKDPKITCEHAGKSGTVMDSNTRVIYEVILPHKTKRISAFNMGFIDSQAVSTNCRITDASLT